MRLLTHNLLACAARTCLTTSKNFPLTFKDVKLEMVEADYNEGFLKGLLGGGKIEWRGLVETCRSVSASKKGSMFERCKLLSRMALTALPNILSSSEQLGDDTLPEVGPDASESGVDEELLRKLHHILLEVGRLPALYVTCAHVRSVHACGCL